jgi:hypothetical protein
VLLQLAVLLQGQVIEGIVYDRESGAAIELADIYFDGTFAGTSSDSAGYFSLDVSKYPNRALNVSAVGYHTQTYPSFLTKGLNFICLVPRRYEIEEVTIGAKSLVRARRKNMEIFRREFLGTSASARSCRIVNESEITFNYASDEDTLEANAIGPIEIINRALGYRISYYLDRFSHDRRSGTTSFIGKIVYKEDLSAGFETGRYERRRRTVYSGSCMHFFRILWHGSLDDSPFEVRNAAEERLGCSQIVKAGANGIKFLSYQEPLDVFYYSNWSHIEFRKDKVPFEASGYYDPQGIKWQGRMGNQRAGDWLPYDYVPE